MTQKMTIHEALATLKLYDKKISRKFNEVFIGTNRHDNALINGDSIDVYKAKLGANLDSVTSMIENRTRLKQAVIMSNAATNIVVAGSEMTVAEAIDRKSSIHYLSTLSDSLIRQFNSATQAVSRANDSLPEKADDYISKILSADKTNRTAEEIEKMKNEYISRNTVDLIDPNELSSCIENIQQEYDDFTSEVDFRLSESNATTIIEIDLAAE